MARRPRRALRRTLPAGLATLALSLGILASGAASPALADGTDGADRAARAARLPASPSNISLVQANIYTGLSVTKYQADVREVLALGSDFITYNEAHGRNDVVMAPPSGYGIYRDMTDRYTRATPVVWRTDRWTAVDQGSWMISDWRGVPPGKQVELGRRWANWVTLVGVDGRQVSVVSAHFAPETKGMPDLLQPSAQRLGLLVDRLATRGQVFVGGDLNVHYPGARYPRGVFGEHALVPTYDALGTSFPTGDHYGATIDYVLGRGNGQLVTDQHFPVELNSDHDAVYGGWTWLTDVPSDVREVVSDPAGDQPAQRAALGSLATAVRRAEAGAVVRVATATLDSAQLARDLRAAAVRGVHVQLIKIGGRWTGRETKLEKLLRTDRDRSSWMLSCTEECRTSWLGFKLGALVMVSDTQRAWTTRLSSNRQLTSALLTEVTTVTITSGVYGIAEGQRIFDTIM